MTTGDNTPVRLDEDNALLRDGPLKEVMDSAERMSCLVVAGEAEAPVALDAGHVLDIVLMDIGLPGMNVI